VDCKENVKCGKKKENPKINVAFIRTVLLGRAKKTCFEKKFVLCLNKRYIVYMCVVIVYTPNYAKKDGFCMKKAFKTAVLAFCLAIFAQGASVPVQDMTAFSLGVEYESSLHGHAGMYDFDRSALWSHMLRLHYAPLPYIRFSAGAGGSHQYANPSIDGAKAGIAAAGGVGLYLPKPLSFAAGALAMSLSFTGGYDVYYLNAAVDDKKYLMAPILNEPTGEQFAFEALSVRGKTAAMLHAPYIGAILHLGRFVDIEAGGLYRYFEAEKELRTLEFDENYNTVSDVTDRLDGAVSEQWRFYGSLTFHERKSGAYLSGGASYAPAVKGTKDANKGYLVRYTAHAQAGLIMRDPRGSASKKAKFEYSDTYMELKERQEDMAESLSRGIDGDKESDDEE